MYVRELEDCRLVASGTSWRFASAHATAIAENWATAVSRNPSLFNGDVFVIEQWSIDEDVLIGRSVSAKFAAYLYWRDAGAAAAPYSEAFATAVVRSRDGGVLLAQSVDGTLNAGLFGAPGGLLDARDAGAGGALDLAGAAARELEEETGLTARELVRRPGFLLAHVPPYLAVTSVFQSNQTGAELVERVDRFLAAQERPELRAPRVVYQASELDRLPSTPFARLLTTHLLGM
ncbi:MAG: NUDIX hydrolase [Hyphomicrobiaceae bacterium]